MKVGIFAFTDDAPTLDTGVTTYNRELAKSLCARYPQHRFSLYLAERNSRKFDDLDCPNLEKIVVPRRSSPSAESRGGLVGAARKVISLAGFWARELAFRMGLRGFPHSYPFYDSIGGLGSHDLLVYTVFGHFPDFPLYAKRRLRARCVSAVHDVRVMYARAHTLREMLDGWRGRYMLSRIVAESDMALVPSNYIKSVLSSAFSPDSRVAVSFIVPDLRDLDVQASCLAPAVQELLSSRERYIFYPSTLVDTKNHMALIEAVHLLQRDVPDIRLVLAGSNTDSPLGRQIFASISEFDLAANVRHFGFISEDDKQALYKGAVALVVPSIGESFSLPIWEAFAVGCAVVASSDRDIPEQVGDAALICNPHDPRDIAARILEVWTNRELQDRLSRAGRIRFEQVRRGSLFTGWQSTLLEDPHP